VWQDAGYNFRLDWNSYELHPEVNEILKAFVFHKLEVNAPSSVKQDVRLVDQINKSSLKKSFPWKLTAIENFLAKLPSGDNSFFAFTLLLFRRYPQGQAVVEIIFWCSAGEFFNRPNKQPPWFIWIRCRRQINS